jgi:hypothetical protein
MTIGSTLMTTMMATNTIGTLNDNDQYSLEGGKSWRTVGMPPARIVSS